jgi:hypothetical protein
MEGERIVSEIKKADDNPEERDIYERIFAEVRNPSDVRGAIARAVRQLREAMEKEDNCAVTAAHVRISASTERRIMWLRTVWLRAAPPCRSPCCARPLAVWNKASVRTR